MLVFVRRHVTVYVEVRSRVIQHHVLASFTNLITVQSMKNSRLFGTQ